LAAVHVYLTGIVAPSAKAELVTVMVAGGELGAGAGALPTVEPAQAVAATAARSVAMSTFLTGVPIGVGEPIQR
jgi:hypothetical protein